MTVHELGALEDALEAADAGAILDALWTAEDSIAVDLRTERRFDRLATAIRHLADSESEAFHLGGAYLESAVNLDDEREALVQTTFEYLADDGSITDALNRVRETKDAYETNGIRREALEAARDEVGVPAVLAFDGVDDVTVPVGTELAIDVQLSNVGSTAATGIDLSITDGSWGTVAPESLDSLDAGASTTVRVLLEPESVDSGVITVSASTDRTGDDLSFVVESLDRLGFIERALDAVRTMIDLVEATQSGRVHDPRRRSHRGRREDRRSRQAPRGRRAGPREPRTAPRGRRAGPSIRQQLSVAEERLASALDALERNAPLRRVDANIRAATNALRSVLRRLENEHGTPLEPIVIVELTEGLTATIGTLTDAIDAE